MKNINEDKDIEIVKAYFEKNNFTAERFDINEGPSKSPDFKVTTRESGYYFFCEVKTISTEVNEAGLLTNRVFNIFTSKIHESVKQFSAVNSNHYVPNVLAFVTNNILMNSKRFSDFLQGFTFVGKENNKNVVAELKKISNSRIKYDMRQIDLFIYIQGNYTDLFLNKYDSYHSRKLMELFETTNKIIKRIKLG